MMELQTNSHSRVIRQGTYWQKLHKHVLVYSTKFSVTDILETHFLTDLHNKSPAAEQ